MDMSFEEALKVVLDLAGSNVLDEEEVVGDPDLQEEKERQEKALDMVYEAAKPEG